MLRLIAVLFFFLMVPVYGGQLVIDPVEYSILDKFFRAMIKEEAFGYVLEGNKPLSALNIYNTNYLMNPSSRFFRWNVLATEVFPIWERLNLNQKNYVFKIIKAFNIKYGGDYHELVFLNRNEVQNCISNNIDLFRYIMGPTIDSTFFTNCIIDSSLPIDTLIKGNNTIMGILLGYGTYNSLMQARLEDIEGAHGSFDIPPFSGSDLSIEMRSQTDWDVKNYLLPSADSPIHSTLSNIGIQPALDCITLKDEVEKINGKREEVPNRLFKEFPPCVFGAFKDPDNKVLFEENLHTQKKVQSLLAHPHLLEHILKKITGEQVKICPTQHYGKSLDNIENIEEAVALTIRYMAQELDREMFPIFIEAFCRCDPSDNKKPKRRINAGVLSSLRKAQSNLDLSETYLSTIAKTKKVEEIVPNHLMFERIKTGEGKKLEADAHVLLSYIIKDVHGHVLSASHRCWVDLSKTITGFSHGIKGMQEGETRKIFIHPSYAYGALTTISPCTSLSAKVTLHQISEPTQNTFPPLFALDLAWVKDPHFFSEVKDLSSQDAHALGYLWGSWLRKSSDVNFTLLCKKLKQLPHQITVSKDKQQIANRVFWNLFADEETLP